MAFRHSGDRPVAIAREVGAMIRTSHLSVAALGACLVVGPARAQDVAQSEAVGRPPITAANARRIAEIGAVARDARRIVWGPGGGRVSFLGWETPVEVLDADTFKPVRQIAADRRLIQFTAAADGRLVAWCENTKRAGLHDLPTGKTLTLDTGNDQPAVALSPDGRWAATGGYGTEAKLWRTGTGELVRSFDAGPVGGLTPVFSPDGRVLAVGNRNGFTRLYETATGRLLHELPKAMSQELKFSPDGRTLAVGYVDGTVGLWDAARGKLLRSSATGAKEIFTLDWTPAGDVLVTAGLEGKITLWDPRTLTALKQLDAPEWVIQVRFSPDGTRLLSAGGPKAPSQVSQVTVWGIPAGAE
jgi:WD40 repeat protein